MAIHVVRVCLYVKLTSYPLSHDSRGSIGWVGHSEIGPLNFACGGMTVTGLYLDCASSVPLQNRPPDPQNQF